MMTYFCEECRNKFQSSANLINKPCNYWSYEEPYKTITGDPNCTFPLKPILSMRISGIQKENNENLKQHIPDWNNVQRNKQ